MDIEQSIKIFLENDFRYLTIGEIVKELQENRLLIKGLESKVEDLHQKLVDAANAQKEAVESKRSLEQELSKLKG